MVDLRVHRWSWCFGRIDGSEIDADYQLKNRVSNFGSPISGTGNPLSFGLQTAAGTYTVVASIPSIGSCTRTMTGSAVITIVALPTVTASSSNFCYLWTVSTSLSSSGSSNSQTSVTFNNSTPQQEHQFRTSAQQELLLLSQCPVLLQQWRK
ncbi:MAG: hypothetical protein IPP27_18770 [Bacteroidetes bacterium]|nr:hypothetical protein [Bacteroidota bacterium]